jgi:hypothetical protein
VRMGKPGNGLCFPLQTLPQTGIGSKIRRQNLDGDTALQPRIASAIHFAHAACSERREDFIRPEFRTRAQRRKTRGRSSKPSNQVWRLAEPAEETYCAFSADSFRQMESPGAPVASAPSVAGTGVDTLRAAGFGCSMLLSISSGPFVFPAMMPLPGMVS